MKSAPKANINFLFMEKVSVFSMAAQKICWEPFPGENRAHRDWSCTSGLFCQRTNDIPPKHHTRVPQMFYRRLQLSFRSWPHPIITHSASMKLSFLISKLSQYNHISIFILWQVKKNVRSQECMHILIWRKNLQLMAAQRHSGNLFSFHVPWALTEPSYFY